MQDIPSFFIDQRIDQLSDERSIKRVYAKALKGIDQETELDAFQALRESYEYAVNWTRHRLWQEQQAAANDAELAGNANAETEQSSTRDLVEDNQTPEATTSAIVAAPDIADSDCDPAWCDTIPLTEAAGSSDIETPQEQTSAVIAPPAQQEAQQAAPEAALQDPVEVARAVLQDLLTQVAKDENTHGHAETQLSAFLDDERLINVEVRDYFEWVLAGHLAQGWQVGNGDLFGAAVKCFGWNEDKYRVLRFGDLGYHINNGLIELSAFNAQNPEAIAHQIGIIRRGRDEAMPTKQYLREHILMVEAMIERYPTWLGMVVSQANIQAWRDAADQFKIARVIKKPEPQQESVWSNYGYPLFALLMVLSSVLRSCGNSS